MGIKPSVSCLQHYFPTTSSDLKSAQSDLCLSPGRRAAGFILPVEWLEWWSNKATMSFQPSWCHATWSVPTVWGGEALIKLDNWAVCHHVTINFKSSAQRSSTQMFLIIEFSAHAPLQDRFGSSSKTFLSLNLYEWLIRIHKIQQKIADARDWAELRCLAKYRVWKGLWCSSENNFMACPPEGSSTLTVPKVGCDQDV